MKISEINAFLYFFFFFYHWLDITEEHSYGTVVAILSC